MRETTMVDRVARALYAESDWALSDKRGGHVGWKDFRDDARAAIQAMREPSDAMLRAGFRNNRHVNSAPCDRATCIGAVTMPADQAWRAMIDAALAEEPPRPATAEAAGGKVGPGASPMRVEAGKPAGGRGKGRVRDGKRGIR